MWKRSPPKRSGTSSSPGRKCPGSCPGTSCRQIRRRSLQSATALPDPSCRSSSPCRPPFLHPSFPPAASNDHAPFPASAVLEQAPTAEGSEGRPRSKALEDTALSQLNLRVAQAFLPVREQTEMSVSLLS